MFQVAIYSGHIKENDKDILLKAEVYILISIIYNNQIQKRFEIPLSQYTNVIKFVKVPYFQILEPARYFTLFL